MSVFQVKLRIALKMSDIVFAYINKCVNVEDSNHAGYILFCH